MKPYVQDADFTLLNCDVLDGLRSLPDESVHMCVTSPPFWGLRDYGTGRWDGGNADCDHLVRNDPKIESSTLGGGKATTGHQREGFKDECPRCGARRVDQQLGLEPTPESYVARMVDVFREVRRVLRSDGVCFVNIGDSYTSGDFTRQGKPRNVPQLPNDWEGTELGDRGRAGHAVAVKRDLGGLKAKDLVGVPWRLAFALQADGWYLRSDIIWSKPNPMPESVTDRPTKAHEYVFLLSKGPRYFFDQEAVREKYERGIDLDGFRRENAGSHGASQYVGQTVAHPNSGRGPDGRRKTTVQGSDGSLQHRDGERWPNGGRNVRSVWEIATEPYPDAHFATFPQALVERCVKAGTSERGCCPVCGKPWEREVERTGLPRDRGPDGAATVRPDVDPGNASHGRDKISGAKLAAFKAIYPDRFIGWRPGCNCPPEDHAHGETAVGDGLKGNSRAAVPCLVLDPFLGSGTTALVARRLGRKTIGIELSSEYCALAATRLQQLSLLAEPA